MTYTKILGSEQRHATSVMLCGLALLCACDLNHPNEHDASVNCMRFKLRENWLNAAPKYSICLVIFMSDNFVNINFTFPSENEMCLHKAPSAVCSLFQPPLPFIASILYLGKNIPILYIYTSNLSNLM